MKRRRYAKVRDAIYGTPWAILPEKLRDIAALVEDRSLRISRVSVAAYRAADPAPDLVDYHAIAGPVLSGGAQRGRRIAVLNVYGTIAQRMNLLMDFSGGTSTELLGKAFDEALADDTVSAIVLNVDSPGGAVPGVMELSDKIHAARGRKSIVTVVNPMMASAALWIGTAADEVVAVPSALQIGSIGAMSISMESSRRHEAEGDTYTLIRSTQLKAETNPYEPLTEAAKAHIQGRIDAIHLQFVSAVARNRGVTAEKVQRDFGGGRTLMADEALAAGLIDRIATLETVLAELAEQAAETALYPAAAVGSPRTERLSAMDPKVRLALVQAGLIRANSSAEEATAALNLFFEARGEEVPTDAAQLLGALRPTSTLQSGAPTIPVNTATAPAPVAIAVGEIIALVATAGASLPASDRLELQTTLIREQPTLSLSQVLDRINARTTAANPPAGPGDVRVTADARDKFQAAARDAICLQSFRGSQPEQIYQRSTDSYVAWSPDRRNYGLQSPLAIASQCLVQAGVPYQHVISLAPMQIAQLVMGADPLQLGLGNLSGFMASAGVMNVTGMFSNIFLDAANVTLRKSFDDARTTYQLWMRRGPDVRDFKEVHRIIAGEIADPKAIPQDGTFDETTLADGKESYKLTVWGQRWTQSWQMVVNDQLSAFTEVEMKMGNAMKRKLNRLAYAVVKDNANLADGGALFNDTAVTTTGGHANLTVGVIADYGDAMSTLHQKMVEQRGLDPTTSAILNLQPRFCIHPPALRTKILKELGSYAPPAATHAGVVNINKDAYQPIEEGELAAASGGSNTAFYLAADPADVDTIEYAFLQGMPAPVIEQQVSFEKLAMARRIYFAAAFKAMDFRGLQKHKGAA